MAWAEKMATGWRGRYRHGGDKVTVTQPDGTLFPRKRDALEAAQEEEVKARRRAATEQGTLSARIAWGDWWDTIVEDRTFDSDTPRNEGYMVEKHIRPKWGAVSLNKITKKRVQKWVSDEELKPRKGMSAAYVRRIYSVFSVSMNKAVKEGVLDGSPCVGVELPKIPKRSKPRLTVEDAEKMSAAGQLRQDYKDLADVGLDTGLRPGELCGLHANRVDLERGWAEVAEVLVRNKRVIRPCPKDEDVRQVPLTPRTIEIIRRNLDGRNLTAGCGLPHTDGSDCESVLVFLTVRGQPVNPNAAGQCLRRAAEKASTPRSSMYAARRGFATRAAEGGMDAFTLADLMGHADVRQTREYVQTTEAARRKVLAALGEPTPLTVVEGRGARGANDQAARGSRGAQPNRTGLEPTGKSQDEKAV